ncbi:heavy metal-associated isoprenylated plant protein 2-like [Juglans microcarpa x Juglans regia]|uniref:heavy metal-associated isoprenylated plant protein 2-like n=1 Tax=Juglans microcarpa x Juglans regia TaxID=2249226 RepID=UPI001B7E5999|nr:heavy metal-associated isoprenylated plant protein 2-like [Juglans microcarpa x Juglans regia]
MVQKTVLKVRIVCLKCKKQLLQAVTKLQGVDKIEVDADKGTLTVTGDADPYEIIVRTKKTGKFADVVSVGDPAAPQKEGDGKKKKKKKSGDKEDQVQTPNIAHNSCLVCERVPIVHVGCRDEPYPSCSIM